MTSKTILVLGSLHYDLFIESEKIPEVGETVLGKKWYPKLGGKGANQAVALSKENINVNFVSAIGSDDFANFLINQLNINNISDKFLTKTIGTSGMSVAISNNSGNYSAVVISGANLEISKSIFSDDNLWKNCPFLMIQNEIKEEINIVAAKEAKKRNIKVFLNAAPAKKINHKLFDLVDILLVNEIETQQLLDTKSTDYIVELPQPINNVTSMELDMIEIPLTYYAVSETLGNNSFNITIGGNDYLIKIADGNYETTQSDLKKAKLIENEINEALQGQGINNISYTVDHTSGRSVFSRTDESSDVSFTLDFVVNPKEVALQLTLGWLLGFRTGEINCLNSIASEGICNIRGPRYAFICIDDYQNNVHNNFICPYESSLVNKPIITRINLETETQSQTVYRSGEIRGLTRGVMSKRDYFGPVNLQRFHIQLIDEYGRVIDLNHMDWSLILMFKCIYEY